MSIYKVIWKSFIHNIKGFLVFFLSAIFTVMMAFGFLYLGQLTKEIKIEGIDSIIGYQLTETIPVIVVVSMCIMAYSVKFYILSRIKDYTMLLILGIRKKTFMLFLILEYLFSWIVSIAIGLVCGNLFVALFRYILEVLAGDSVSYSVVDVKALYIKVILCCIGFMLGVVVVILVYLGEKDLSDALKVNVVKAKRPAKKIWLLFAGLGVVVITITMILSFAGGSMSTRQGGIMMLVLSTGGIYLILYFGLGVGMERVRQKQGKRYYKNMLKWNQYYYRLSDNMNIIALQIVMGMAILYFVWTVSGGIWRTDPSLYPYDVVCDFNVEAEDEIREILEKYSDDINCISYIDCYYINGGLNAISNTTSEQAFGETFDLKDNEFAYLWDEIYQFDRGLDRYSLAVGWDNRVNNVHRTYFYKAQKRMITLGRYSNNPIIFSDEEFEYLWNQNISNHKLITANMDESLAGQAETELKAYAETHPETEVLAKKTVLRSVRMEGIVRFSIMVFTAIALLAYMIFILCIRMYSEIPVMRQKYQFLRVCGMRKKERRKLVKKEVTMFILPPTLIASAMGFLHCFAYTCYDLRISQIPFRFIAEYSIPSGLWIIPQMGIYLVVMCLFTLLMRLLMIRWMEKE